VGKRQEEVLPAAKLEQRRYNADWRFSLRENLNNGVIKQCFCWQFEGK
jgi:hypothetical protein